MGDAFTRRQRARTHSVSRLVKRLSALTALVLAFAASSALAADAPFDCTGPAGDPAPGTPEWHLREQANDWCGEQRAVDTSTNPLFGTSSAITFFGGAAQRMMDPYRDPAKWNGSRGRYRTSTFTTTSGQKLPVSLFLPPASQPGPYPGVIVVHGGSANQEMYLWGSEGLAEAGYLVMSFQIPEPDNAQSSFHYPDSKEALRWFMATPDQPTKRGQYNPVWRLLDHAHVGMAGHSAGGVAVSRLGQEDSRVKAVVSWDRAQSTELPSWIPLQTPELFIVADFNCQKVPVCVPQPYTSPPNPLGPGNKDNDFRRLRKHGVDTEKIALRAATHLDFTQFGIGTGSRYGAAVAFYYTLAWFDRYLRDNDVAEQRLVGTKFDDSGDVHNISGGVWDPQANKNVPAFIAGQPVADRLSFHFRSAYWLDGGALACEDMRAGC